MAGSGQPLSRYSSVAILLHWTIAILIIANIAGALITDGWEGPARGLVMGMHKAAGMLVLVLSLARLAWRLGHRPPPLPAEIRPWERMASASAYVAFYFLMIAMPLSGWLMVSAAEKRRPFNFFGLFDLPFLPVQGDKALGGLGHDAHGILGYLLLALVVLHVAAALKHHFFDRTRLIARMWPGQARAG